MSPNFFEEEAVALAEVKGLDEPNNDKVTDIYFLKRAFREGLKYGAIDKWVARGMDPKKLKRIM